MTMYLGLEESQGASVSQRGVLELREEVILYARVP
jgi:hypothetical protein